MNALTLLKNDHKTVAELFRRFERSGDEAYETKRDIVDRIVEELSVHAAIEELVFYPAVRTEVRGVESDTLEALEEHHIVKWTLSELDGMDPHDERFVAKVTVLIESVRHHVKEEESDLFPKVTKALSRTRLNELGDALAAAKKTAPTRPHPRLPDTPPLNAISGAVGLADKVAETVVDRARGAIGRVTSGAEGNGASKPRSTTRKAAGTRAGRTASAASKATKRTARSAAAKAGSTAKTTRSKAAATRSKAASTSPAKKAARTASKAKGTAKKATSRARAAAR